MNILKRTGFQLCIVCDSTASDFLGDGVSLTFCLGYFNLIFTLRFGEVSLHLKVCLNVEIQSADSFTHPKVLV